MIPETVSQPELAALLGISTRHLRTLSTTVFKPTGDGRTLRYPLAESIRLYIQHRESAAVSGVIQPAAGRESRISARERLDLAKAEREELALAKDRKEVITIALYEEAMTDIINPARHELLALKPRLMPHIGMEAANKVGEEVTHILRRLAGDEQTDS